MAQAYSTQSGGKRRIQYRPQTTSPKKLDENTLLKLALLFLIAYLLRDRIGAVPGYPANAAGAGPEARAIGVALRETRTAHFNSDDEAPSERFAQEQAPDTRIVPIVDPQFSDASERAKQIRLKQYRDYVDRFAPVAVAEMRRYGIPASLKLAQALLESQAGGSDLAQKAHNHFRLKCFSQKCATAHCVNYVDGAHKEFFVQYPNAWGSYRAHSELLKNNARYRQLFRYRQDDYISWARGLVAVGYAADLQYADKLIAIIQHLQLDRYDEE
ncbi:MAG: glucosaminidase domain-containing protein [Saprospiraceae bacterium]